MWSHVAFDLYFYVNYTLSVSLLPLFWKYKIKIAPGEFYRRFLFIFLLRQYTSKLSAKLIPFIYSAVA